MKKFFVLYLAPVAEMEKMMANANPEQQKQGMAEWMKWMEDHKKSFVDMGGPVGKTTRITSSGISAAKNDVGGYSIIEAESREAAAEMFKDSPHFSMPGAYIDVIDIVPMPEV